jgi:hypothetical protein
MVTTAILTHKVASFPTWKQVFDSGAAIRANAGITIKGVYQSTEDENIVTIVSEFPDMDTAKAIFSNKELQDEMKQAGVISAPEIKLLNHAF